MTIGGLQKVTLIDFPGRIAATVFLCGCNFRCPWCYTRELVLPEMVKLQPKIPEKKFFSFLKTRQGLLAGIVICGGEPTIHKDLPDFIEKIKKMGYLVKLDTNGSNPGMLKKMISDNLLDYVAMDIKVSKEKYAEAVKAKVKIEDIEKSIKLLKESNVDYEFRTTVVPTVHTKEDIVKIAKWLSPAKRYYLQNFRPEKTIDPEFEKIKPYSDEDLLEMQKAVAPFFEICEVR